MFTERNSIELFLKRATDFFKKMFEEYVGACAKTKKKEKTKYADAIVKLTEERLIGSRHGVEAIEMYSRQIKKHQVTLTKMGNGQKDYLKDFHQSLIKSFGLLVEVSSPQIDRIKNALKNILMLLGEIQVSNEYLLQSELEFYIEHLSFTSSFETGYQLAHLIFKRLNSTEFSAKFRAIDGFYKMICRFKLGIETLRDEDKFRHEITNLLNLIIGDVNEYTFKTFPNELVSLIDRLCGMKLADDFVDSMIKRLTTICNFSISVDKPIQYPEEASYSKNPFSVIMCKFCAKAFESNPSICHKISEDVYANLMRVSGAALIMYQEVAFFDLLKHIKKHQFEGNQIEIFNVVGNFTSILCSKASKNPQSKQTQELVLNTTAKFVAGMRGHLLELGPVSVTQSVTEYIKLVCKDLKEDLDEQIGLAFLPLLAGVLAHFENINEKTMTEFFKSLSSLVSRDEVFSGYRRIFVNTLFRVHDHSEMHMLLGYYHIFFMQPQKNKFLKTFLSEMLVSMKDKEMQNKGWPIAYELINFTLESFEFRSIKELREMKILNPILRVFQMFKMFIKKREENKDQTEGLSFSSPVLSSKEYTDLRLFCDVVKKFSQIFRNDQDLINDFSDMRGYEKICQDAAFYIESDEDASIVIRCLKEMAYFIERPRIVHDFNAMTQKGKRFENNLARANDLRFHSVVGQYERGAVCKVARNTMKQGEKLTSIQLKDLSVSASNIHSGNATLLLEETLESKEVPVLKVPQIIYGVILYLLDRAPISDREEFVQDLIHQAQRSQENFTKMREGGIFYSLVYNILHKDGMDLELHTQEKVIWLFKRRPTLETYRLLYDYYFTCLEKRSNKDYSELSQLITFDEESQSCFAEYTELTNDKAMQNHYVAIPSLKIYNGRFERYMNVHIEPLTFSMWLARSRPRDSRAKFTIFSLVLILNDSHRRKIELYWVDSEIRLKISMSTIKTGNQVTLPEKDDRLYPDHHLIEDESRLNPLEGNGRALHVVLTLNFQNETSDGSKITATLYLDGVRVNSKIHCDPGNFKSSLSKDQKKNTFKALCFYGYNQSELTQTNEPIETTKIREVFLKKTILKDQEIQLLYAIYTPQAKVTVNWFNDVHAVNLRNINKDLKEVFKVMNKAVQPKSEELKFPDKPLVIFVKLNTRQFFNDMEFLLNGVPDPRKTEDPKAIENGQNVSAAQSSKFKNFLQASYNIAAIMKSQVLNDDEPLLAYLVYFNKDNRVNNTTLIRSAFSSDPNFEYAIRSLCILERYLTFFNKSSEKEILKVLATDGLRTFQAANLTTQFANYNISLLMTIQKMTIFPKDQLDGLVGLFGIKVKDSRQEILRSTEDKNKESTHILVDPVGICLLFSIFCKDNWFKRLDILLRKIRTTYLKESIICQ